MPGLKIPPIGTLCVLLLKNLSLPLLLRLLGGKATSGHLLPNTVKSLKVLKSQSLKVKEAPPHQTDTKPQRLFDF